MAEVVAPAAAAVVPTTPAAAPAAEAKPAETRPDLATELAKLRKEHELKKREHIIERRKWEQSQKASQSEREKLAAYEKRLQQAKLNPEPLFKEVFGDNWYEKATEFRLNGVAPSDAIASELEKMREEFNEKLKGLDTQKAQQAEQAAKQQVERARQSLVAEAGQWLETQGKDYPALFDEFNDPKTLQHVLAQHIEQTFHATTQRDESGEVIRQGKVMTAKEAAEDLENHLMERTLKVLAHEKYKGRLTAQRQPATVGGPKLQQSSGSTQQQSGAGQQRRTLSNEITGSTPGRKPPTSAAERRERAIAAFEGVRKRT